MSELGKKLEERYEEAWRVQELRERLAQRRLEAEGAGTTSPRGALAFEAEASNLDPQGPRGPILEAEDRSISLEDPQATAAQRNLAGRAAVKLLVKEEGLYRVSRAALEKAGLSTNADPRHLRLYAEGREIPIRVVKKVQGEPRSWSAIKFYGTGLDTVSTDTRVYWLVEGSAPGRRIRVSGREGGPAGRPSFPCTVEKKDRMVYFAALKNGDRSNWFGPAITELQGAIDLILEATNLDRSARRDPMQKEGLIEVGVQGATDSPHVIRVLVNDEEVGTLSWEGQAPWTGTFSIPHSALLEGENLVTLLPLGGEMDVSLLDYIRFTYPRSYTADGDELKFQAQAGMRVSIDGFSTRTVQVFDVTNERDVIKVRHEVAPNGAGGYRATMTVPGHGKRTLLALADGRTKVPAEIRPNRRSSWREKKSYDFLVIAHRSLVRSLRPLRDLRESEGLSVAIVDIEDVYDEFGFGEKDPRAVKDFLLYANRHWSPKPQYVLLVGDASWDPRDYYGFGDQDYVPTKLVDTVYMETASDDWFVDFDDDGLPEMAIGRLPVQTKEEADAVISKTVGYGRSDPVNEALLVADQMEQGDYDFEMSSERLEPLLPHAVSARRIFRGQYGSDAEARNVLLESINEGPLLVNYVGHGSVGIWRGDLLTSADTQVLTNERGFPLFISMTCLNGFFQSPFMDSLGEVLIKVPRGGAVAVWASSGLTVSEEQSALNREFVKLLFDGESLRVGEAARRAKAATTDQDVRKTWILFGDPSMRLKN